MQKVSGLGVRGLGFRGLGFWGFWVLGNCIKDVSLKRVLQKGTSKGALRVGLVCYGI